MMDFHKEKFEIFCNELLRWGKIHSLSGYKSKSQIIENIEDSLYPLSFIEPFQNAIDIGSGAGFPSIALAIARSDARFILIEPNNKKFSFLQILKIKLNLKNLIILKDKVENISLEVIESKVDLITSRALYKREKIISLCSHLLKDNGYFLLYKGTNEMNLDSNEGKFIRRNNRVYIYEKNNAKLNY